LSIFLLIIQVMLFSEPLRLAVPYILLLRFRASLQVP